jgi:hypothetical protein
MHQTIRKIALTLVFGTLMSVAAEARDFAVSVGARTNSWDISPAGAGSGSGKTGLQAGVLGFIDIGTGLQFRSGFLYTQRLFTATASGFESEYNFSYFDVPLTIMYKFSDFGGVFGGGVLALNSGKSCSGTGCSTEGVKSSLVGFQFGASFKFAPQMGGELYYESIPGDIQSANGTAGKDAKSVVANLLFTFE